MKSRRVKFHPEVDARREKRAIKLLDASINSSSSNNSNNNSNNSKSRSKKRESQLGSISYYEPCL